MVMIHYYIYECEDCIVNFAVEQTYHDHSAVQCPICLTDDFVKEVGSGSMENHVKDEDDGNKENSSLSR